ncbi:MAG: phosphotransferase [Verrucomicrobia bacterium]|nr:phosphotransferase [Verrucomicrobiota bacterium]
MQRESGDGLSYPAQLQEVLSAAGVERPVLLGVGEDAWAFAHSDSEAIRIFPELSVEFVEELADMYGCLGEHQFSFECPCVYEVRTCNDIPYTIEKKLPGRPMPDVCRTLRGSPRRQVLQGYMAAIAELGALKIDGPFGGLIPSSVWSTSDTWERFLQHELEVSAEQMLSRFLEAVPDFGDLVSRIESSIRDTLRWDSTSLVHGDAYPGNIMVDDAGRIVSVLDFGRHSLLGDPRLDVAIAIELTDVIDEFTQDDTEYLRELVDEEMSGPWRALSAILLANQLRGDERIVRKCAASLAEAVDKF